MSWVNIQDLIPKTAGKYHFKKTMDAIEVCREYRRIVPQILSDDALEKAKAKSFKDNTLTIAVPNSAWAQQIHMNKIQLKQALQQKFGEHKIRDIKIELISS
jgi:predicted nucleic acid-binding Zn ribbon protein